MANKILTNGYNQRLIPGMYHMTWGERSSSFNLILVVPHGTNQVTVVELCPATLQPLGSIVWHVGPDECLTDPVRILHDPEQEDSSKWLSAIGENQLGR